MSLRSVSIQFVVRICQSRALDFRTKAAHERKTAFGSAKDRDKAIEFEAKAQAIEQLGSDFEANRFSDAPPEMTPEVENLAREISPQAFSDFDAMIIRLRNEGYDDGHASRSAYAVYGADMEDARALALDSIDLVIDPSDGGEDAYGRGISDAIDWHEQRAREADVLEGREVSADKKVKFKQRAERHRLYARTMRRDFDAAKAARRQKLIDGLRQSARQRNLPLAEDGVPLEVQHAFLRRKGDLPDETFD